MKHTKLRHETSIGGAFDAVGRHDAGSCGLNADPAARRPTPGRSSGLRIHHLRMPTELKWIPMWHFMCAARWASPPVKQAGTAVTGGLAFMRWPQC